ncbi:hypothetical protein CsSME_00007263 [Camellia sinensis var. sinensis]
MRIRLLTSWPLLTLFNRKLVRVACIIGTDLANCHFVWLSCPAADMVDGSKAFWRTPHKPFRQRFLMVKPCPKEKNCDVELSTYAIRDAEEYKNFCDRSKDRPQPEEVIGIFAYEKF